MNPYDAIETCRGCLVWVCEGTLAVLAVALFVAVMLRTGRGLAAALRRSFSSPGASVAFALCLYAVWCGGTKRGGNPPGGGEPPPDRSGGGQTVTITAEDIARGWRLEGVATNGAVSYAMPSNGVEYARWSLRGGRETHFALDLGDFRFPAGTGVVRRIDVLSGGAVESLPRSSPPLFSVCAAREWASLVPGTGRFWWTDAEGGAAKLLTWENVYAGRDLTGQYSAQVELRGNGDFTARSNHVERVFRRVPPFDWDDDGLENSVDPDPLVAGPDAHGTNAEWYNNVCSNVFLAAETPGGGVALSPRAPDVNTNAYYFVDVVVSNGPAPVWFLGDRESRLGDPVIVARAGETNRVPLLIGIDYAVTSAVPFTVSVPEGYPYAEAEAVDPCAALVRWPLVFAFSESVESSNRFYTVAVEPYDPGGVLELGGSGGVPMRGGTTGGGCDCLRYGDSNMLWYVCSRACTCGSTCAAEGTYRLENALFAVAGGQCRCGFDDPPDNGPGEHDPDQPSLTVTFSHSAVIFENEYEGKPGVWTPRRSTRVRLTVDAYGGANGGTLSFTTANLNRLQPKEGVINLPQLKTLSAQESFYTTCLYEGDFMSAAENDVLVRGTFTENVTGRLIAATNCMTVVRVGMMPGGSAPNNNRSYRHEYGIGEEVYFLQSPDFPILTISANDAIVPSGGSGYIKWGVSNVEHRLSFSLSDVEYTPLVKVMTPTGIEGYDVQAQGDWIPADRAGGLLLVQRYRVLPLDVDFTGLQIEEVPCDEVIPPTGYFTFLPSNVFAPSHTSAVGAGKWYPVDPGNYIGLSKNNRDYAGTRYELPRMTPWGMMTDNTAYGWLNGGILVWKVPFGWKSKDNHDTNAPPVGVFAEDTRQIMSITPSGDFSVQKLRHSAIRFIDGTVILDGNVVGGTPTN